MLIRVLWQHSTDRLFQTPSLLVSCRCSVYSNGMRTECQHLKNDMYEFLCLYVGITDVRQVTFAEVIDWCVSQI